MAAQCLLEVLGVELDDDNDQEIARAVVGAGLIARALRDLSTIRKALTSNG